MKRSLVVAMGVGAAVALAGAVGGPEAAGATAPKAAKVTIRHQLRGCHAWSVNGGAFRAAHSLTLAAGGVVTFVNNDVMPHKLVQNGGPAVQFIGSPNMNHMSASVRVRFLRSGDYRLSTRAGADYMKGVRTIGEDNVLRLKVLVR